MPTTAFCHLRLAQQYNQDILPSDCKNAILISSCAQVLTATAGPPEGFECNFAMHASIMTNMAMRIYESLLPCRVFMRIRGSRQAVSVQPAAAGRAQCRWCSQAPTHVLGMQKVSSDRDRQMTKTLCGPKIWCISQQICGADWLESKSNVWIINCSIGLSHANWRRKELYGVIPDFYGMPPLHSHVIWWAMMEVNTVKTVTWTHIVDSI